WFNGPCLLRKRRRSQARSLCYRRRHGNKAAQLLPSQVAMGLGAGQRCETHILAPAEPRSAVPRVLARVQPGTRSIEMGIPVDSRRGRVALMVAHCAGMVDLVALSIWVGALIAHYGFDPQQAGGLPTLFLVGAVLASVMLAPWIQRLRGRWVAAAGFGISALAFAAAASVTGYAPLAVLHAIAGAAAGAALSVTHGTIARSENPHRLFAIVGIAL